MIEEDWNIIFIKLPLIMCVAVAYVYTLHIHKMLSVTHITCSSEYCQYCQFYAIQFQSDYRAVSLDNHFKTPF